MVYSEHQVGELTVVVKRDRHRKYTARVYRGNALSAILAGKGRIMTFIDEKSCSVPGCPGDYRYAPPGRRHNHD